ncbi:MAG: MOSC domain-containing protein [Omnitrophica bacterium]|nr:MOSC domain-containing protein [Candidatus Omnitrophota bacterium]
MKENNPKIKDRKRKATVVAVSISEQKGIKKRNVESIELKEDFGITGDAHAGTENRQVSLLSRESIEKMKRKGLSVGPGDFAENITTEGIDLLSLNIGTRLKIGREVLLEISQLGKQCHRRCNIYYQAGDCVMPREGRFARVRKGGIIRVGDSLEVSH